MGFSWVQSESRQWISLARTPDATSADADGAAALLCADYARSSRWGIGLLGFALAIVGVFTTAGMIDSIGTVGMASPIDILVLVGAIIMTIAACGALIALWTSGRRILVAAAWWLRLPHLEGGRPRRAEGWLRARTVNFEPPVFARLASGTLAALLAIADVSLSVRDLVEAQVGALSLAALMVGIISLLSALGQLGGVIRLVRGVSEADPLWVRIRSSLRGS